MGAARLAYAPALARDSLPSIGQRSREARLTHATSDYVCNSFLQCPSRHSSQRESAHKGGTIGVGGVGNLMRRRSLAAVRLGRRAPTRPRRAALIGRRAARHSGAPCPTRAAGHRWLLFSLVVANFSS